MRAMLAAHLGTDVYVHDDGSQDGMFDLVLRSTEGPYGAVEITAAADPESIQAWKLVNGDGGPWIAHKIAGGWLVTIDPTSRIKRLLKELPPALGRLEDTGVREWWAHIRNRHVDSEVSRKLSELKVMGAVQGGTSCAGSIYVTLELANERSAGVVPPSSDEVSIWVADFLKEPHQADVLRKLERSRMPERHAFVLVPGFTSARWPVPYFMLEDQPLLPEEAPPLPSQVTHVWLASSWRTTCGLRWAPDTGWEHFEKGVAGASFQP